MKKITALLILVPCIIVTALIIIALPDTGRDFDDEEGSSGAFNEPANVTNSSLSFFTAHDQISAERKQRRADKPTYFTMSDAVITTDYTKNNISILPDIDKQYTGTKNLVMYEGEPTEFTHISEDSVTLKGGQTLARDEAFDIILSDGLLGSADRIPHRLEKGNIYYAAFTSEKEALYFEFTSGNEFVSIRLANLTGRVEYTLLNSDMQPIKNDWNGSQESVEIQYKGIGKAKYYLKVKGSYSEEIKPFSIDISSDTNEWQWQMVYPQTGVENRGRFNYYGDEDFFVLPPDIVRNIDKAIVKVTKADAAVNFVVYDKNRTVLDRCIYKPGDAQEISMFGLTGAYAISIYSYDGNSSGAEYGFTLDFTDATVLGIETYGFSLNPEFSEDENYYTASVNTITDKKIISLMHSAGSSMNIEIALQSQEDGKTHNVTLGKALPLGKGRNTVTLKMSNGDFEKEIVIVISYKPNELSFTNFKYTETTMPDSYKAKIDAIRQAHPNYIFKFVKTGADFNEYVTSQLGSSSKLNNATATKEQIAYYVDPRNFLTETGIFMFENAHYSSNINYSETGIRGIWNSDVYPGYIMEAAESTGLSPYFIAARATLESGRGTSKLAKGMVSGYEGYYNFYGIGAYDIDPNNGGAAMAKSSNWNTKRKAIIEGAAWINRRYISWGQPTCYFMKFCFVTSGYGWHQYMTDLAAPSKDSKLLYDEHSAGGSLNSQIEFIIPVFDNMP